MLTPITVPRAIQPIFIALILATTFCPDVSAQGVLPVFISGPSQVIQETSALHNTINKIELVVLKASRLQIWIASMVFNICAYLLFIFIKVQARRFRKWRLGRSTQVNTNTADF